MKKIYISGQAYSRLKKMEWIDENGLMVDKNFARMLEYVRLSGPMTKMIAAD